MNHSPATSVYMNEVLVSGRGPADTSKGFIVSAKLFLVSVAVGAIALLTISARNAEQPEDSYLPPARAAGTSQVTGVTLTTVEVDGLGPVVTDQDGMTLYRFTKDEAEPPRSNCDGECAATWLPMIVTDEVTATGLDEGAIGTVDRMDGATQATIGGWPVYRFSGDTVPGEVNGQGIAGTWYAVAPDGSRAGPQGQQRVPPPAEQVQLVAAELPDFGPALTDQNGMTLYLFTNDGKAPSESTCDAECAVRWPPVLADGDVRVTGVDQAIVGGVTRKDGTEQVTVGGWPVYRFAKDSGAGQTGGHGVGGTWFVIEPLGCKSTAPVRAHAPETTPPDTDTGT